MTFRQHARRHLIGTQSQKKRALLEKDEERHLEIAKAHRLPITQEEYEEKKKKLLRNHAKKDSKTD